MLQRLLGHRPPIFLGARADWCTVSTLTPSVPGYYKGDPAYAAQLAVTVELDIEKNERTLRERIQAWREANPFPPRAGLKVDKAFFDDLSGEP
jgi:hypothetical protein